MKNEKYPPQYILALVKIDPDKPFDEDDIFNAEQIETYVFDLTEEGDLLVASCMAHHIIISAPTWKELEPKINSAFQKDVMGKHDI